jgi:hypothetical protein
MVKCTKLVVLVTKMASLESIDKEVDISLVKNLRKKSAFTLITYPPCCNLVLKKSVAQKRGTKIGIGLLGMARLKKLQ